MKYEVKNNEIIIPKCTDFDIKQTLECGQVFRFKQTDFGYEVYSLNHKASIYCQQMHTIIKCDDVNYFINYFDLLTDYAKIKQELSKIKFVKDSIPFGEGIRIINQDPFETIISFLISQNNNIPRIKKIIENICLNYGDNCGTYFGFPTVNQLAKANKEFFTNIKCGYRDAYLFKTVQDIYNGFNISNVYNMTTVEANKYLTTLCGVGPKVADCILLFGYHKTDVFPTDTWIKKVYNELYPNQNKSATQIRDFFVNMFGDLAGYAQQYLFYAKREKNI